MAGGISQLLLSPWARRRRIICIHAPYLSNPMQAVLTAIIVAKRLNRWISSSIFLVPSIYILLKFQGLRYGITQGPWLWQITLVFHIQVDRRWSKWNLPKICPERILMLKTSVSSWILKGTVSDILVTKNIKSKTLTLLDTIFQNTRA